MEKIFRIADSLRQADDVSRNDDAQLSVEERFVAFMRLMEPYYAASPGLQRVFRVDAAKQRQIHDDWGLCVQFVQKS